MSLELELQAIVTKNLPAEVVDALSKRLEQAGRDAGALVKLERRMQEQAQEINSLETDLRKAQESLMGYASRENDLVKRERAITTLELTAQFEKEKRELTVGLFSTVFQNRQVRESVIAPMQAQYWQPGCSGPNQYPVETKQARESVES